MTIELPEGLDPLNPEDYERIVNSVEFKNLLYYFDSCNARFADLPLKEKKIATAMFLSGKLDSFSLLDEALYWKKPPTIKDFLMDNYWIGSHGKGVFPYWLNELEQVFDPNNTYIEGIFGGAIGIGKSTVARWALTYNHTRICCLKEPQLALGVTPDTFLATQFMSVNLDKASYTLVKPVEDLLRDSMFYHQVKREYEIHEPRGPNDPLPYYVRNGDAIHFPNNIIIKSGSTESHALGISLIGAMLDEAEFRSGGVDRTFDVYEALKERVLSRFLGSRSIFLALVSSAKLRTGVIYNYTKNLKENDPHTRIMGAPIWEVKDFEAYKRGHFYVMNGTQTHPSEILSKTDQDHYEQGIFETPPNCEIIKVPEVYRPQFEGRLEKALQNLAGKQTARDDQPFDDLGRIEDENLIPEFNLKAPLGDERPLFDRLPRDLFIKTPNGLKLKRYPNAPRYIHLDLAETSEAGICMLHKEIGPNGQVLFVVDFICWVTSPTRIGLSSIKQLMMDLRSKADVPISTISADQFQSAEARQDMEVHNTAKKVKLLSVDRTTLPYHSLSSIVGADQLKVGKCNKLKDQLENISLEGDDVVTRKRKDMADSLCGALENARENVKDQPTYYYDYYTEDEEIKKKAHLEGYKEL